MEEKIKVITTIFSGKTANEIAYFLKIIKIMHKFTYYLEKNKEVDRNKIHNLIRDDKDLVRLIAKNMGLKEIKRKTSSIARRPGRAWVVKK